MQRAIVYMDMQNFFIECERLLDTSLCGIPLVIAGGRDRGTVVACSKEAYRFGVRIAMPIGYAFKLCPQARLLKGDYENYTKKSHELSEIIKDSTPLYEKASIQSFYLDVSGMDRFFGCFDWTKELSANLLKHSGLHLSWALSVNKTVSKIGTIGSHYSNPTCISSGSEKAFLNPQPIKRLPQIGNASFQLFSRIGIRSIGNIAEMPPLVVQKMLGSKGKTVWQRANGIDKNPVEPYLEKKELSEQYDFEKDCIDLVEIRAKLIEMIERLAFKLRTSQLVTSKIILKVKYNNLDTETKSLRIAYTSLDHILKKQILGLFTKLYHRRMRLVRVGIRLSDLVQGAHQIDLFDDTKEHLSLYAAMDNIRKRYGIKAIGTSAAMYNKSLV